jgi:hypothetical protein
MNPWDLTVEEIDWAKRSPPFPIWEQCLTAEQLARKTRKKSDQLGKKEPEK